MKHASFWLFGVAIACLAFGGLVAWAEDAAKSDSAAETAVAKADPDDVDPNTIKGEKWTLDFRFDKPEPIVVTTPEGDKQVYWYVVYTVTNNTKTAHEFVPSFTLFSDTTSIRHAGIYPWVFDAIQKCRKIQFLENAVKMIGKIQPGEDNARTGVAIFAPLDRQTDKFTIFVGGLSGEYIERPTPDAQPEKAGEFRKSDEKKIRLFKTLALTYDLPGDQWWLNLDQPIFVSKAWTWR